VYPRPPRALEGWWFSYALVARPQRRPIKHLATKEWRRLRIGHPIKLKRLDVLPATILTIHANHALCTISFLLYTCTLFSNFWNDFSPNLSIRSMI
jgi:hypothetical protein